MQENCINYYDEDDEGCCLICEDAEDGCLCYNCKCTRCFNYTPQEYGGICDLAYEFKQENKKIKLSGFDNSCCIDYSRIKIDKQQKQLGDFNK